MAHARPRARHVLAIHMAFMLAYSPTLPTTLAEMHSRSHSREPPWRATIAAKRRPSVEDDPLLPQRPAIYHPRHYRRRHLYLARVLSTHAPRGFCAFFRSENPPPPPYANSPSGPVQSRHDHFRIRRGRPLQYHFRIRLVAACMPTARPHYFRRLANRVCS